MRKFYAFIVNPTAGNGKTKKIWRQIKKEIELRNIPYRSFFTQNSKHAEELVKQLLSIYPEQIIAIVAIGGDGTIHEVINGVSHFSGIPVGYIPGGSGNDFARGFSISTAPKAALKTILHHGKMGVCPFDIGECELGKNAKLKRFFVNSVGAGFDAEVAKAADSSTYKRVLNVLKLGRLSYVIALFEKLMTYQPTELSLKMDGVSRTIQDVWFVTVSNTPFYGGGMKISPSAKPNDGVLNVCLVSGLPRWKLLLLFMSVFLGWHKYIKEVEMFVAKEIQVESSVPLPVHADGEYAGYTPYRIKVRERSQHIFSKSCR